MGAVCPGSRISDPNSKTVPIEKYPVPTFSKHAIIELYHCRQNSDGEADSVAEAFEKLTGKPTYGAQGGLSERWNGAGPEYDEPKSETSKKPGVVLPPGDGAPVPIGNLKAGGDPASPGLEFPLLSPPPRHPLGVPATMVPK